MEQQDDERYLGRAIELARGSVASGGGPFGAVIVAEGTVVSEGQNRVTIDQDPSAHAEVVAIRRACQARRDFRLPGCTLYASTEPCPMCLSASYWARVERIVFAATRHDASRAGFDDELLYRELSLPLGERHVPTTHVPHERSLEPFELWDETANRIRY